MKCKICRHNQNGKMMENVLQDMMDLIVSLRQQVSRMEEKLDRALRVKDCMDGEILMDNSDLCRLLGVTKRTLQRYRQLRLIKFYSVEGKTLYKSSEVAEFINKFEKGIARKKSSPLYNKESKKQ